MGAEAMKRLAIALLLGSFSTPLLGCDSGGKKEAAAGEKGGGSSELAKASEKDVSAMKDRLGKGEDIKFACAGNMAKYKQLGESSDEGDKKAYAALGQVCYVDLPNAQIAQLRKAMESGELKSTATVDLETTIEADGFPKDGDAAKVAAEATKVLEVEVPMFNLSTHVETAKKEKEEGKSVSMGCIKAKQVIDKNGTALEADEKGKAAVAAYNEACPAKK